jgi:hypothetical protein
MTRHRQKHSDIIPILLHTIIPCIYALPICDIAPVHSIFARL